MCEIGIVDYCVVVGVKWWILIVCVGVLIYDYGGVCWVFEGEFIVVVWCYDMVVGDVLSVWFDVVCWVCFFDVDDVFCVVGRIVGDGYESVVEWLVGIIGCVIGGWVGVGVVVDVDEIFVDFVVIGVGFEIVIDLVVVGGFVYEVVVVEIEVVVVRLVVLFGEELCFSRMGCSEKK